MPNSQVDAHLISQQVLSLPRAAALPAPKRDIWAIIHRAAMRWHEVAAKRRPFRTHRRWMAATLLIVGLMGSGLSVSTWRVVSDLEDHDANREFKVRASNQASVLQRGIDEYLFTHQSVI